MTAQPTDIESPKPSAPRHPVSTGRVRIEGVTTQFKNGVIAGGFERNFRSGVQRDQVHLRAHPTQ